MEALRVKTDASVKDGRVGIGYVVYQRKDGNYHQILRDSHSLDASYDANTAEEIAIVHGLSAAQEFYSTGSVVAMTDCKGIVERIEHRGIFSHDKNIRRSLSAITDSFDETMIKWIPKEDNMVAHEACRCITNG